MEVQEFDAVVIGAGPGGYVCAIRLAQLGKKTAIIEREYMGGVCLNVGCIPSKALIHAASMYHKAKEELPNMGMHTKGLELNMEELQAWKQTVVKKMSGGVATLLKANGVTTIQGTAKFVSKNQVQVVGDTGTQKVQADDFIVATGSRVMEIPPLPFNDKNIISSTEALELSQLPQKLVVVGGGFIGLEIGIVYAKLGSQVTIVEALDQVLANVDKDLVRVLMKRMKQLDIHVYTKMKAQGLVEADPRGSKTLHLIVDGEGTGTKTIEADVILVSVGRVPNSGGLGLESLGVQIDSRGNIKADQQGKTTVPGVWAIGDVTGAPQLAHRASMDGLIVAAAIAGEPSFKDYKTVPWAVFSDPEIAVCGLGEQEAKDQGFDVQVGTFPFAANGRAVSTNDTEGLIKVLVDAKSEAILGVHIVGPEASNLIAEAALAIEMGATVEDIVRTIHTHPTLPEAFPEAVEATFGKAIHIYKPVRKKK